MKEQDIKKEQQISESQALETESRRLREYLVKLGECFLLLGNNPVENINCLIAICGEFMEATCALYNRLERGMLCSVGQWHTPVNHKSIDKPEGHICYDVIMHANDNPFIVHDLQNSPYAMADPNVITYKLETYVGLAVKFNSTYIGSLCVVFQKDFTPSQEQIRFMRIVASAIAVEENHRQTQLALQESNERDKHICETVTDYVFTVRIKDGQPIETKHGPMCIAVTGYTAEELAADPNLWIKMVHEEDRRLVREKVSFILKGLKINPFEHRIIRKDGALRWVRNSTTFHFDKECKLISYTGLIQDITERKKAQEALSASEEEYSTLVDNVNIGVYRSLLGPQGRFIKANPAMAKIFGYDSLKEFMQITICQLYRDQQERAKLMERIKERGFIKDEELRLQKKDGTFIWASVTARVNSGVNGEPRWIDGVVEDITERKKSEDKLGLLNKELIKSNKRLSQLALRDPQTGLYNHRYLQDVIEAEFYRAKRYAHSFSVMMLDVDYFKSINDVYGHLFGDLVLKQLARQLKRMVRQYDIVIRFGGEEFMIISPGIDRPGALKLARRLLDAINLYNFGDKDHTVKLKLSIAVASYPEDKAIKGMDLVETTDQILDKLKEYGGNNVYSSLDIKKKNTPLSRKPKIDIGLLRGKMDKLTKRTNQSLIEAVFAFAKTIELKDQYTGEHVEKTVQYAVELARAFNLPDYEIERIKQAAMLHDLGKIGIAEKILVKKTKLTKEEFEEIKKHPQIGVDIIRPIKFLHNIIPIILGHHERWDGKGYPKGLKKDEIPMGARVVAIADVYQALTSNRPYRKAYSEEEAVKIIKDASGTQFDPVVVIKFLQIIKQRKE